MPDDRPLSDERAHDRLLDARKALGEAPGATIRANTALEAARRVLDGLGLALLFAAETGSDEVEGVRTPED